MPSLPIWLPIIFTNLTGLRCRVGRISLVSHNAVLTMVAPTDLMRPVVVEYDLGAWIKVSFRGLRERNDPRRHCPRMKMSPGAVRKRVGKCRARMDASCPDRDDSRIDGFQWNWNRVAEIHRDDRYGPIRSR